MADFEDNPLAVEIMAERASAYFATTRKMQAALAALSEFDQRFAETSLHADQERRRHALFAEAAEQVWFFVIQREAMRLPYYDDLFSDFGIPPEVKKAIGPKDYVLRVYGGITA